MVTVLAQTVWLETTVAVVGGASRFTVVVAVEGGHTPLLIFHSNALTPTAMLLRDGLFTVELLRLAAPETTDQLPVPTEGIFPVRVAVVAHIVWLADTVAAEGTASLVTVVVAVDAGQLPLMIRHSKLLTPVAIPVAVGVLAVLLLRDEPPLSTVQLPVPTAGMFDDKVAVFAQIV
jgi:hypothetical protein